MNTKETVWLIQFRKKQQFALWVFDNLINNEILSGITVIKKLEELYNVVNPRLGLPKNEYQKL
ncbi:MAG: hypothetical protein GX820_04350 [Bacteroidales bacterium]|nr:hypothetical protein [Bacteroidales bacterium]